MAVAVLNQRAADMDATRTLLHEMGEPRADNLTEEIRGLKAVRARRFRTGCFRTADPAFLLQVLTSRGEAPAADLCSSLQVAGQLEACLSGNVLPPAPDKTSVREAPSATNRGPLARVAPLASVVGGALAIAGAAAGSPVAVAGVAAGTIAASLLSRALRASSGSADAHGADIGGAGGSAVGGGPASMSDEAEATEAEARMLVAALGGDNAVRCPACGMVIMVWSETPVWDTSCCHHPLTGVSCLRLGPCRGRAATTR